MARGLGFRVLSSVSTSKITLNDSLRVAFV